MAPRPAKDLDFEPARIAAVGVGRIFAWDESGAAYQTSWGTLGEWERTPRSDFNPDAVDKAWRDGHANLAKQKADKEHAAAKQAAAIIEARKSEIAALEVDAKNAKARAAEHAQKGKDLLSGKIQPLRSNV